MVFFIFGVVQNHISPLFHLFPFQKKENFFYPQALPPPPPVIIQVMSMLVLDKEEVRRGCRKL